MTIEPIYSGFDNPDCERIVREAMGPLRFLFPSWVRQVTVFSVMAGEDPVVAASIDTNDEYRTVEIYIYPPFFDTEPRTQRRYMIHELLHAHLQEVCGFVRRRLVAPMQSENEKLWEVLRSEHIERIERVVQELTFLIEDNLQGKGTAT